MTVRDQLLRLLAESAVERLAVPPEKRPDAVANLVTVFNGELSRMFGGETVSFSTCRVPHETRAQRNQRIVAALEAGEPAAAVARREQVSVRLVRWLRQKRRVEIAATPSHDAGSR